MHRLILINLQKKLYVKKMIRLTASQAAASAAWGQTWEIRIPVCSAIDSGEVNLAWEEMWKTVSS